MTTSPYDEPLHDEPPHPPVRRPPPAVALSSVPVDDSGRLISLDLLRGVAVLGILVMNIVTFGLPFAAYSNPTALGEPSTADYRVWFVSHVLADLKMMTIFSMLFGAGVLVMTSRAEARSGRSAGLHYRRMGWLVLFGLLHAHGLWFGDILFMYAMCGMVLYVLRDLKPVWLVLLAVIAFLGPIILIGGLEAMASASGAQPSQAELDMWQPSQEAIDSIVATYRGGWLEQASHRSPFAAMMETFLLLFFGPRAGAMMLLGMAMYKWGWLSAAKSQAFYGGLFLIGIGIGLPLVLYGVAQNNAHDWSHAYSSGIGMLWNYVGSVGIALAWIALVMLVAKSSFIKWFTPLIRTGQMALTNYLMQTVICTTIFYGHGLGYFGSFTRTELLLTTLGVCVFQLTLSPIWLRYFRFGPMEWLWRSLTYLKVQPMLRSGSSL